jgi:hypothetical protein
MLAQFIDLNEVYKFIYDYTTDTHIFMSKYDSFYSLGVRSYSKNYVKGTGVLVQGCPQTNSAERHGRIQSRETKNSECDQCYKIFGYNGKNFNDNKIGIDLLRKMCRFDCAQIGNITLSQMLFDANATYFFGVMGDKEKNASQLAIDIIEFIENNTPSAFNFTDLSSTTTATTTTTTKRKAQKKSDAANSRLIKNAYYIYFYTILIMFILSY